MMVLCEPKHVGAAFRIQIVLIIWQFNVICVHQLDNKEFDIISARCNREYIYTRTNKILIHNSIYIYVCMYMCIYIYIYVAWNSHLWKFFPTSDYQCSLFSKKNPVIRIFCISGWLLVPINPDKWSSAVFLSSNQFKCILLRGLRLL
jgi:hypothetical protein